MPRAVWDGDLGTTWQTDGLSVPASAYVYVTLGAVLPIETIRWVYGTGDIGDQLTIQVSNDKVTWTPIQHRECAGWRMAGRDVRWSAPNTCAGGLPTRTAIR